MKIAKSDMTQDFIDSYTQQLKDSGNSVDETADSMDVWTSIQFVSDEEFKELLRTLGLNEQEYMSAENPKAIVVDGSRAFNYKTQKFEAQNVLKSSALQCTADIIKQVDRYTFTGESEYDEESGRLYIYESQDNPGETIKLPEKEATQPKKLTIGKVTETRPFFFTDSGTFTMYYPYSLRQTVCGEYVDKVADTHYYVTTSDHATAFTEMKTILTDNGMSTGRLFDYAENAEQNRNLISIVNVFAYGFIILISLIAVANVFNTVSTNISLRRREFAMLKSIGMTKGGFNRMMNYECLLYGTRALLYGLPVSAGVTYLIYRAVDEGYSTGFTLPWAAIGIAVLSVFAVVFATMMYSMSKVKKDNPIDALKNENI